MTEIREFAPELYCGGQPTPEDLARLVRDGVRTVINLRHPSEPGQHDERAHAERCDLHYVNLPVTGPQDLDAVTVQRFADELERARARGPVLIHCASANRVGALIALQQSWHRGCDPDTALARGRAAGLAGLEPAVACLLAQGPGQST